MTLSQASSSLFPYTTLFRSQALDSPVRFVTRRTITRRFRSMPASVGFETLDFKFEIRLIACAESRTQHWQLPGRSEEHTLNSSHVAISYAVFCLKKKKI